MNVPSPITGLTEEQAFGAYQQAVKAFNDKPSQERGVACRITYRRYLHTVSTEGGFIAGCIAILDQKIEDRLEGGPEIDTYRIACDALDAETEQTRRAAIALGDKYAKVGGGR